MSQSTAEKRAELESAGTPWPECECHGRRMLWSKAYSRFYCDRDTQMAARRARGIKPAARYNDGLTAKQRAEQRHPPKSAADKYAEIGGRENAPPCECHGQLMAWNASRGSPAGGYFKCKQRVAQADRKHKDEHRERFRARRNGWRAANVERARASERRAYAASREHRQDADRAWRQANRFKFLMGNKASATNGRPESIERGERLTAADLIAVWNAQDGHCTACEDHLEIEVPNAVHLDHIEPLIEGGSNTIDNIQFLCRVCHIGHKTPKESKRRATRRRLAAAMGLAS